MTGGGSGDGAAWTEHRAPRPPSTTDQLNRAGEQLADGLAKGFTALGDWVTKTTARTPTFASVAASCRDEPPRHPLSVTAELVGPGTPHPGGHAYRRIPVGPHNLPGDIHDVLDVDPADGAGWVHAGDKTCFGAVLIANARHVALVQQRRADGALRPGTNASDRLFPAAAFRPVRREDVGTQVPDALRLLVRREDLDQA